MPLEFIRTLLLAKLIQFSILFYSGGLGMGVTIDKSRGNTIAEAVSIKSVTEGGSAALATSPRGVGLKLGKHIHGNMNLPLTRCCEKVGYPVFKA